MSMELKEYTIVTVAAFLFTFYHAILSSFYLAVSHDVSSSFLYIFGVENLAFIPLGGAILGALWVSKKKPFLFSELSTYVVLVHLVCALGVILVHAIWQAFINAKFLNASFSYELIKFDFMVYLEMRFFAYIIIVGLIAGILKLREKELVRAEELRLEMELYNEQLKEMELKINPEIIYPNLSYIREYAKKDAIKASKMVIQMAKLLRKIVDQLNHEKVPIAQDLEFLRIFLKIISLRLDREILLKYEVKSSLSLELVPSMVLLFPFIEEMFLGKYQKYTPNIKQVEYFADQLEEGDLVVRLRFPEIIKEEEAAREIKTDPIISKVRSLVKELRDKEYKGSTTVENGALVSALRIRNKGVDFVV